MEHEYIVCVRREDAVVVVASSIEDAQAKALREDDGKPGRIVVVTAVEKL